MDKGLTYSVDPNEVLRFQLRRTITHLFKSYLTLTEELGDEHDIALNKLKTALPDALRGYVDLADYLTPERGTALRKKILDGGNDTLREVDKVMEQFDIEFKR